ncbi:FecR family protein [Aquimarina sp. I32.4]|uniref:FecR family protein n=1 Tax=Aquimarina sp. I32.4 TaxID=2053903 RepID=UPI000CDEA289|nr:FecR domain-containing protein [Aquimarina sp. I32.4]
MEITPELLQKYAEGKCSKTEELEIESWLDPKGGFDTLNSEIDVCLHPEIEKVLWKKIAKTKNNIPEKQKKILNIKKWTIVASIVILLGTSCFWGFFNKPVTYATAAAELKTIILEDGTKVTLNAASTLTITKNFNKKERVVLLDGEAFFEVIRDSLHPFVVQTKTTKTQVLGTKFNLYAYTGEDNTITLNEGKVQFSGVLSAYNNKVILLPNEQVTLNKIGILKKKVKPEQYNAWIKKKLVFRDKPFSLVIREIERFYNITITVKKEGIHNRKYNGVYDNPPLEVLMNDLSFVFNFNYKKEENKLLIF